jgi:hypothetical protein
MICLKMNNLISDKQQSLTYYIFLPYMKSANLNYRKVLLQNIHLFI